ncbi:MAG: hypothetical protein WC264_00630 [Candidatus Paceibacterota bacterium]|jgi:3-methyladenine DNA glycosylase/8-oxoguanine DNA glycosylase
MKKILKNKVILKLFPTQPFQFDSTFHKPDHFSTPDNYWESGTYYQTMLWQGKNLGLVFKDTKPTIILQVFSEDKLNKIFIEELKKEIIYRYNLDLDVKKFYKEVGDNKILSKAIKRFKGMRPSHSGSLYEYIIIAITLQNATVRRTISMMQALFDNYGMKLKFAGKELYGFWDPKYLVTKSSEEKLRALKLGYRAKSIYKISKQFTEKLVDEFELRGKSAEEQEKALVSLYGIGPASTDYMMEGIFHRFDYLRKISPWEQKIYTKLFWNKNYEKELVPTNKMIIYFQKEFGVWKKLAVHYIWEDLWWQRKNNKIDWLEKEIRL